MTVPGIGPASALTILAEAGDLRRFRHHRQFLNFCGSTFPLGNRANRAEVRATSPSMAMPGCAPLCGWRRRPLFECGRTVSVRKFDNDVCGNPLDADLRRKAYTAVATKLARVIFGLIKNGSDYRSFFEHKFQVEEPSRARAVGAVATP